MGFLRFCPLFVRAFRHQERFTFVRRTKKHIMKRAHNKVEVQTGNLARLAAHGPVPGHAFPNPIPTRALLICVPSVPAFRFTASAYRRSLFPTLSAVSDGGGAPPSKPNGDVFDRRGSASVQHHNAR